MGKKTTVQVLVVLVLVLVLVLVGLVSSGYGSKFLGAIGLHIGTPVITLDVPVSSTVIKVTSQTRFNWEVDDGGYNVQSNLLCIWDVNLGKGSARYCESAGMNSELTIGGLQKWTQILNTLYRPATITPGFPSLIPGAPGFPINSLSWYAKVKYKNSYGDMVETTSNSRGFILKK